MVHRPTCTDMHCDAAGLASIFWRSPRSFHVAAGDHHVGAATRGGKRDLTSNPRLPPVISITRSVRSKS